MKRNLISDPAAYTPRRARRRNYHIARRALATFVDQLREIDQRLAILASAIPEPGKEFDVYEELGRGVRCVRTDLLEDAIITLETLAYLDDDALIRRHEERCRLLPHDDDDA